MIPGRRRGIVNRRFKRLSKESTGEMAHTPFEAIEKKITDLAGMVRTLKKEKEALASQLEQKSAETRELARKVDELTRERNEIRGRVDTILSRLETVEL